MADEIVSLSACSLPGREGPRTESPHRQRGGAILEELHATKALIKAEAEKISNG